MKNHFIFPYAGNKREEVERIYEKIDLTNITTIIEPFCGTSAMSLYISLKNPKIYKYILNDNNTFLTELYMILKDEQKTNKLNEDINNINQNITKEKYNNLIKENNMLGWVYSHLVYTIRPGLFPLIEIYDKRFKNKIYNFNHYPITNFLRNEDIIIVNENALNIYEQYKNNETSFIFLDPPYLQLCNDFYLEKNINIYEYLSKNNINLEKSKIYLCLEDMWIIKLLFANNKIIDIYNKLYQTSKKKQHIY